jgi:hypothetical protein
MLTYARVAQNEPKNERVASYEKVCCRHREEGHLLSSIPGMVLAMGDGPVAYGEAEAFTDERAMAGVVGETPYSFR